MDSAVFQDFLLVGLGNPGLQYEKTRHNIGFLIIKEWAKRREWVLKQDRRFNALAAKGVVEGKNIHLLLPLTYMNLSGTAVKRYLDYYKLPVNSLVVVADDVALPYGRLRLKPSGSAGGHNGLKNLQEMLGTLHYTRLRVGVGQPKEKNLVDHVLGCFEGQELEELPTVIDAGVKVLDRLLKETLAQVMSTVNTNSSLAKELEQEEKKRLDLTKPPLKG